MALPDITQNPARFGKVTWTALAAVLDSTLDPDDVPDETAVEGLIIFKPSTSLITYTNAVPKYTRILANRQVALKDAQIDEQGRKYVKLEANVLGANPAVFTWKATFVVAYAGVTVRLPDAEFTLAPDQEIDLTDYLDPGSPVTKIPGLSVTELQQMIADFGSGLVTKDFADSEYLQQNATPGQVYATDWSGNQSPMSYDSVSWPDYSFVQRDAGGIVRGGDPIDLNDMVTKGFADKKYGQISITVASSDTPIALRRRADYVCSGTNDLATIQQALDALPDDNAVSGEVLLLAGNYNDGSGGTLSIGSQSSSSKNPRKVLRFQRGARINVSNRTGRIAVIKVESPDCQVVNPNVAGNSAFGNGTALAIGGDVATFGGRWDRVCNRVLVYEPILSNMETALEFSSIDGGPGVGGSTGDCKVYGGYYFQNKTGIRAAGYTNTVYAPCLANNDRPIWVESRRSEAQLRVHDPAIVGWNEVGIAVDGGFGSVFSNVWMEQNPASGSSATEAIRMGLSRTVRASGVRFTGSTHIQLVAEQYAIKYIGAIGTEVEELVLSTSGAVPSVAVARNELPSTSKNNRIRKITFGPTAIPSHTVLSIDAAAWGELFIDRVPGLVGADGFSTRRNPSTRASSSPVVRKTVDVSKTSDTTLAVDSDLTVNLNAGTTYSIDGMVFFDASQTGDFKMALSVSAANGSISWVGLGPASSHTSGVGVSSVTTQRCTSGFVQAWGGAGAGVVIGVFIKGVVTVQDLATLTLAWAQNTADATPSILKAGSYLELTPLT